MTKIFEAIDRGDHGLVWQLVQSRQHLGAIDEVTGLSPLALAAELGRTETVRTLLEAGVDANSGGTSSPLESAVAEGHVEIVKLLLEKGADINQKVAEGYTPLMTAAFLGDVEIARLLLKAGAQPRARNESGESAIDIALAGGFDELSRELRDFSRRAFEAEQRRQEEERRRREEEVRERRRAERRARIVAARASRPAQVPKPPRAELPRAKPPGLADFDSPRSPSEAVAAFDALFSQTAGAPAPVDPMAYEGVERFAVLLGTAPVRARRMIDFGEITGEERTARGETPLMLAATAGEADVVRVLLDRGVEVDLTDGQENGETALLKAVQMPSRGRRDTIEILVDAGAELERKHGPSARTPLMFAAQADIYNPDPHGRSFADATRQLIKLGARLDAEDANGDTVLAQIKSAALGAPSTSPFRSRLFEMVRVLESASGAAV